MLPSAVLNGMIVLFTAGAVAAHWKKNPMKILLRFFTVLSNLFCAAVSAAVLVCRLTGAMPVPVSVLKHIGTAAVAVTLITVLLFLGPNLGYKKLLTGPDFWLHLACPVFAIVSYGLWDKMKTGFGTVLLGVLPLVLYGFLYLYKVVVTGKWEDFYGFNKSGKWPLSFVIMGAGAFLISWILWLV